MSVESNPANAYLRTKVLTASREELRLMLLDGAIKFATQGREGLAAKNYEASYNGISQCRNIVLELLTTIKPEFDPELCERVKAIYTFLYSELVEASLQKSVEKLDGVIKILNYERETWAMLMDKVAAERAKSSGDDPARPATLSLQA
ncbi:MAG: flagellar export chaperone FliS [Phycisphaeraceae bacterium]|nr:flagellar export chaperone FliS [Phycisphaeraceae bacterium]